MLTPEGPREQPVRGQVRKSLPGRGNGTCTDLEVGNISECLGKRKTAHVVGE